MIAVPGARPVETLSLRLRDGVRLDADIYYPDQQGPHPVLLMRQPYGRRIASTVCYAHPSWYAAQGYIVLIQDVRGRGSSEGRFRLFEDDAADGAETIEWAAQLPGSSGAVGMYGFSYQGTNQLLAASAGPPALKAVAPAMIGWELGSDWAYENGAFCLQAGLGWAIQMAAEDARLAGDAGSFAALLRAARRLAFDDPVAARPAILSELGRYGHYADWLDNPPGSDYWRRLSPHTHRESLSLPALFIGGWYDSHLPGTLAAFKQWRGEGRLIVGPWLHFPWGRRAGGRDFGEDSAPDIDRLQIRWFDHWLKGKDSGLLDESALCLFEMGRNQWRELAAWPTGTLCLHLAGHGRASLDEEDGSLSATPPGEAGCDRIVHDPWRPVPAVGGPYGTPAGPVDRAAVDARPDVLTFTTSPLESELRIAGDVGAELWLTSDAPSFDVSCVLSRVSDGKAIPLAQGYRLVSSGTALDGPVVIPMRSTCASLAPGERLRLSVAGACFPAYPINPGTGEDPTGASLMSARTITLGIRHGAATPSRLLLGQA